MDPVTVTFLVVGAIGVALLLVALLVGEAAHVGHLGADADGPFSLPAIAAFIGGAGFVGAIPAAILDGRLGTGATVLISAAVGLLGALPLAWGAIRLSGGLMRMRTDATPDENELAGTVGVVITPVPESGYGEVRLRWHGQDVKLAARRAADSLDPLPTGTPVYVTRALSATAVEVISTAHREL